MLKTERLRLTALGHDNAPVLETLMQREREHLAPWIDIPDSPLRLREQIAELAARPSARQRLRYLVHHPDSELPIGCVGLDAMQPRCMALTYWFAAAHTGQGYAREAVAALCELVTRSSSVDRLEIWCRVANTASARVARELGFARAGSGKDMHVWIARPAELGAWSHARRIAAELGHVETTDTGLLRMRTDHGELQMAVSTVAGEPYISIAAILGHESMYSARASLAHNATLAIGSLVIDRGALQLRYGAPPPGVTRGCLALLLHEAFRLRRHATARLIQLDAFASAL